jgi:hypothetical protein
MNGKEFSDKENAANSDLYAALSIALGVPNIWSQPPVHVRPEKIIILWFIAKIASAKPGGYEAGVGTSHFVGIDNNYPWDGAVSSVVTSFNPLTMTGVTESGRVYKLIGRPDKMAGGSRNSHYTIERWAIKNGVSVEDATQEFCLIYGVDLTIKRGNS